MSSTTTTGPAPAPAPVPASRIFEREADTWRELESADADADAVPAAGTAAPASASASASPSHSPSGTARPAPARWYVVEQPGDVLDAAQALGLPTAEVRARLVHARGHRSRVASRVVRVNDHAVYVVVPTASYADEQVTTGAVALFVTADCVVSAESGDDDVTGRVVDRLSEHRSLAGRGALPVLAATLVEVLAGASEVELALGEAVAHLESVVFQSEDDPLVRLYNLKREIAEARRALVPLTVELPDLGADASAEGAEPLRLDRRLLERLSGIAERVDRHLDAHDGLLSDMLSVRLSQISVRQNEITLRQNEDMRKISAWAAIAAVPTLIAGIYGMNFHRMPELGWTWGYPAVLVLMAGLCLGLHRAFRRAGWL